MSSTFNKARYPYNNLTCQVRVGYHAIPACLFPNIHRTSASDSAASSSTTKGDNETPKTESNVSKNIKALRHLRNKTDARSVSKQQRLPSASIRALPPNAWTGSCAAACMSTELRHGDMGHLHCALCSVLILSLTRRNNHLCPRPHAQKGLGTFAILRPVVFARCEREQTDACHYFP